MLAPNGTVSTLTAKVSIADKTPFCCHCAKVRNGTLSDQSFLKPISG